MADRPRCRCGWPAARPWPRRSCPIEGSPPRRAAVPGRSAGRSRAAWSRRTMGSVDGASSHRVLAPRRSRRPTLACATGRLSAGAWRRLRGARAVGAPTERLARAAPLDDLGAGSHHRLDVDAAPAQVVRVTAPAARLAGGDDELEGAVDPSCTSTSRANLVEDATATVGAVGERRRSRHSHRRAVLRAGGPDHVVGHARRSPARGAPSSLRRAATAPAPRRCGARGGGPGRAPRRRRRTRPRCRERRAAWPPGLRNALNPHWVSRHGDAGGAVGRGR